MNERIKYAVQESRSVSSPEDSYDLLKQFLGGVDWDYFIVVCSSENQPAAINLFETQPANYWLKDLREIFHVINDSYQTQKTSDGSIKKPAKS